MSAVGTLLVTFTGTVGGAVLGVLLRPLLPQHHLRDDSKDVIKLGAGVIATLAALVLGLLVGSAKSSFDAVNTLVVQTGAKMNQPFDGVINVSSAPLATALRHIGQ